MLLHIAPLNLTQKVVQGLYKTIPKGFAGMKKWTPTGDYGLRYREHQSRTTGVGKRKRLLRYYVAVYKWQGKTTTDAYGWEGHDFHNYDDIVKTAIVLRQNRRNKLYPFTLKELLEQRNKKQQAIEEIKQAQAKELEAKEALVLDRVFKNYCEARSDKKSLVDEKGYYKNWIQPDLGTKKLDEIMLLDLEHIKKEMTTAGKAARSIQYIKSIIRQIYNFAAERSIYNGTAPTTHFLKNQKTDNNRQRYLSQEEADKLLAEIKKISLTTYRVSLLSLNSGMRFGEISSLQWQHIDTENRAILVIDPKNGENRTAYMTDAIVSMFISMKRGKAYELLFPSTTGKKMDRVSNTFAKVVNDLDLNEGRTDRRMKVVFHTLRHSCASWLVNSGVEIPVIAKILGHKTLTMTMRYSHVNDRSVRHAMSLLDDQSQPDEKIIPIKSIL